MKSISPIDSLFSTKYHSDVVSIERERERKTNINLKIQKEENYKFHSDYAKLLCEKLSNRFRTVQIYSRLSFSIFISWSALSHAIRFWSSPGIRFLVSHFFSATTTITTFTLHPPLYLKNKERSIHSIIHSLSHSHINKHTLIKFYIFIG